MLEEVLGEEGGVPEVQEARRNRCSALRPQGLLGVLRYEFSSFRILARFISHLVGELSLTRKTCFVDGLPE
jgi:hypothetical protein